MKEKLCHQTRKDVFEQCGVEWGKRKSTHNVHHIVEKSDVKRGLVDRHFPVNSRCNLVVLPIPVHKELHDIMESEPAYRNCIECRVWLANMAFNGDLDLI
jgi:hypothetical protein